MTRARVIEGGVELHVKGVDRLVPRVVNAAESGGLRRGRPVGVRAEPRDRLHQPHRKGAARLMPVVAPVVSPAATAIPHIEIEPARSTMAASRIALRALILRDLRGPAQELRRVRDPHRDPAVPARVRVPVRVPVDRPGRRRRRRQGLGVRVRHRPRPGRRGDLDHVPGNPGRGPAAGDGVRLHARDRGSRAGALPDLAGGRLEGPLGRRPGAASPR